MTDRTDPNRHLPPHPRSAHCVEGVCTEILEVEGDEVER